MKNTLRFLLLLATAAINRSCTPSYAASLEGLSTNQRVLSLSPLDHIDVHDSCSGTIITGSSGSGKSTTAAMHLARGFLAAGMGGLVLTAKREETEVWRRYVFEAGREKDLIVFSPDSQHAFDGIHYLMNMPGTKGDHENIVEVFSTLLAIGKKEQGAPSDRYWEQSSEKLMRHSIKLLFLAGQPVSIANIDKVIQSLPTRPGEYAEPEWNAESFTASLIAALKQRENTFTKANWNDLEHVTETLLIKWPAMDPKPRSSIESTWSAMADSFLFEPYRSLFSGSRCTFVPDQTTFENKIIICAFPLLQVGIARGRFVNCMLKLIFMQSWLARDLKQCDRPAFLWQDEAAYYLLGKGRDSFYQQTCRGARIANVMIFQNLSQIAEEFGEHQISAKTQTLVSNFSLRLMFGQNDPDTNQACAKMIGQHYRDMESTNIGQDVSIGRSQQLQFRVLPDDFTRLRRPDLDSKVAECIVYNGGAPFEITKTSDCPQGKSYLRAAFSR